MKQQILDMDTLPSTAAELEQTIRGLETLADWMDSKFVIPGTDIRFGLDSIIGLIPGVGDTLTIGISAYIIGHAKRHGVPSHIRLKMMWNVFIDWLIGLVPVVGDLFDVAIKANRKNVELLKRHARGVNIVT